MLYKLGVFLTTQELRIFFEYFDTDHDGGISLSELINTFKMFRETISASRLKAIRSTFNQLCNGSDKVAVMELGSKFVAEKHPRVLSREKTADHVRTDFLSGIAKYANDMCDEEAFVGYYMDMSCTLPQEKENYFIQVLQQTWGLNNTDSMVDTRSEGYVPTKRIEQLENIVFEKIRQRTHGAEDDGRTIYKVFKHFDMEGHGSVSIKEFKQVLHRFGCYFTDIEFNALFNRFDENKSGKVDYEELTGWVAMKGAGNNPNVMNQFRMTREPPHSVLD